MPLKPLKYILISVAWLLIAWKAMHASMTYDESVTVFYIQDANIWPWLFDKTQWSNANNHWLNTLLMQFSTGIFGNSEFAIRLFNVISFGAYGYLVYKISEKTDNRFLGVLFIFMMCFNPYVNDFFSTVRGYCYSITFVTGMLYFISQYVESKRPGDLYLAVASAYISTLSMLSSLIFIPAIGLSYLFLIYEEKNIEHIFKRKEVLVSLVALVILLVLTYIPITSLSKSEEFKWGVESMLESFTSLIRNTAYTKKYVPDDRFLVGFFTMALIIASFPAMKTFNNVSPMKLKTISKLTIVSFISVLILMVVSKSLFKTLYPVDRKTIVFIPFISIILIAGLEYINDSLKKYISVLLCIILGYHFIVSYNSKSIHEWWYDSDTENIASIIDRDSKDKVNVASHWMFKPTLMFYNKTAYDNNFMLNESREIDSTNVFDYYVCFDSDMNLLKEKYNVFYENLMGIKILKKK